MERIFKVERNKGFFDNINLEKFKRDFIGRVASPVWQVRGTNEASTSSFLAARRGEAERDREVDHSGAKNGKRPVSLGQR